MAHMFAQLLGLRNKILHLLRPVRRLGQCTCHECSLRGHAYSLIPFGDALERHRRNWLCDALCRVPLELGSP
jgi:hypothetical protein